jgi:hypothetical protein
LPIVAFRGCWDVAVAIFRTPLRRLRRDPFRRRVLCVIIWSSPFRRLVDSEWSMTIHWWPVALAHIPKEDPWAHDHVIVAEIKYFDDGGHTGARITISALVPIPDLDAVCQNLAALDNEVRTSGPWPFPREDKAYEPRFWIEAYGLSGGKYEPLVLSWRSHDHTVFTPDPGFLMTYGLAPRPLWNGAVHWDDPARPVRDIVKVTAPSVYSLPKATPASVSISREYLQDYLTLRKKALVQSFQERRFSTPDGEIEERLGSQQFVDHDTPNRRLRLLRIPGRERIMLSASGARLLAVPGRCRSPVIRWRQKA